MNVLNYYVTCSHIQVLIGQQAYLTHQIVLFELLNSIFSDTQIPKRRPIEILVENEMTEQRNSTAVK